MRSIDSSISGGNGPIDPAAMASPSWAWVRMPGITAETPSYERANRSAAAEIPPAGAAMGASALAPAIVQAIQSGESVRLEAHCCPGKVTLRQQSPRERASGDEAHARRPQTRQERIDRPPLEQMEDPFDALPEPAGHDVPRPPQRAAADAPDPDLPGS